MAFRNPLRSLPFSSITGLIDASQIDSVNASAIVGFIEGSQLAAESIDGKTITGALIRTVAAGHRWEITEGNMLSQTIDGYTGAPGETVPAQLTVINATPALRLVIGSPAGNLDNAVIVLTGRTDSVDFASEILLSAAVIETDNPVNLISHDWVYPALGNSWGNVAGFHEASYRAMVDGTVLLRGLIAGGTAIVFTLPAAFRPVQTERFTAQSNTGTARVDVLNNGEVSVATYGTGGANTSVSLSGIRFSYTD